MHGVDGAKMTVTGVTAVTPRYYLRKILWFV